MVRCCSGTYTVFFFCRKFVNANFMKRIKSRRSIERLIHFIDRQGLVPIFILMCFPFTPNTLVNFVASFSHIRGKYYFIILLISKLISITFLAIMGKSVTSFFTHPVRAIMVLIVTIALWFVGKKVEGYFMGSDKE